VLAIEPILGTCRGDPGVGGRRGGERLVAIDREPRVERMVAPLGRIEVCADKRGRSGLAGSK
jgi:hypothetical protein